MEGSDKNYWITMLLTLYLGYTGAHQFYLGQWKRGLLYLFLLPFILPAIYFWLKDSYQVLAGGLIDGQEKILPSLKGAYGATKDGQKREEQWQEARAKYQDDREQIKRKFIKDRGIAKAEIQKLWEELKEDWAEFKKELFKASKAAVAASSKLKPKKQIRRKKYKSSDASDITQTFVHNTRAKYQKEKRHNQKNNNK